MDRILTNRASSSDLPLQQLEAEAGDFVDLAHGQSPGWHADSPVNSRNSLPSLMSSATPVKNIPGDRDHRSYGVGARRLGQSEILV
jgi:hypothetical protein